MDLIEDKLLLSKRRLQNAHLNIYLLSHKVQRCRSCITNTSRNAH